MMKRFLNVQVCDATKAQCIVFCWSHNKKTQNLEPTTLAYEKNILCRCWSPDQQKIFAVVIHHLINKFFRTKIPTQLAIAEHTRNSFMVQGCKVWHLYSLGCVCSAVVCAGDREQRRQLCGMVLVSRE